MSIRKFAVFTSCLVAFAAHAQDEGAVVKKERIERDKGIFVGGGVSIAAGSNLGDYSTGINFEGGFNKRINRVFSIGGSISYLKFAYDPAVQSARPTSDGVPPNFYYGWDDTNSVTYGYFVTITGGDVSLLSLAVNLKLNFVPVKDNSIFSVYVFARPFVSSATVSGVNSYGEYWEYSDTLGDWFADPTKDITGTNESKTTLTGGIFLGPGIEINPAKPISFFVQASFGYTFPIEVVSTKSYSSDLNSWLADANFPYASLGFTSINFAAGISFNID
jgi:hypothetical protein